MPPNRKTRTCKFCGTKNLMWLFDEATKKFFLSPDGTNRHICADIIVKSNAFLGQHIASRYTHKRSRKKPPAQ